MMYVWDNDKDREFDEALDEMMKEAQMQKDISNPIKLIGAQ